MFSTKQKAKSPNVLRMHFSSNDRTAASSLSNPVFKVLTEPFYDMFDMTKPIYVCLENFVCVSSPAYVIFTLNWVNMPVLMRQFSTGSSATFANTLGIFSGGGAQSGRMVYALGNDTLGIPLRLPQIVTNQNWEFKFLKVDGSTTVDGDFGNYMFTLCFWQKVDDLMDP